MKRRQFTHSLIAGAALPSLALLPHTAHAALGELKIALEDYSKRFMSFYQLANTPVAPPRASASEPERPAVLPSPDQRWELYKKVYDGNPRNLDEAKWREEFEQAWPKYASALEAIRGGFNGLAPSPADVLGRVGGALRMEQSLTLTFIAYVGTFSGKIAQGVKPGKTLATDGSTQTATSPYVAFEVESYADQGQQALALALSDTCIQAIGYSRSAQDNMANSLILNGVYMHAARLGLGIPSVEALLAPAGVSAATRHTETLRSLRNKLQGPANLAGEPEQLYAGAMVVDRWLARGLSLQEVLRTPKNDAVRLTGNVLDGLLKK